jgi:kynurenine formamidase
MDLSDYAPVDLSVLVAPGFPVWPGNPEVAVDPLHSLDEPPHVFNQLLRFDEHAGTHWDAPAHFIRDPAVAGLVETESVPLRRLITPACVLDATALAGTGEPGRSPIVGRDRVEEWERLHRRLRPGDAFLLHTGWTDTHYRLGPGGDGYAEAVVGGRAPAWPGLDPDAMRLLVDRQVATFGTDTPSAGPMQDVAEVHRIGLGGGLLFIENLTGLHQLPAAGAWLVFLPLKLVGGSGAPGRAIGLVPRDGAAR